MTEYTTSSQAIREYMSSRERTAYWVQSHSPNNETEFYSPSFPPSEIDGLVPSSPVSDAGSSHSLPPKMVLRFGDGRPDVPISRAVGSHGMGHSGSGRHHDGPSSRSQTISYNTHHRSRSGSHGSSPLARSHSRRHDHHRERSPPRVPEEIRILPSHGHEIPRSSSTTHTHRSKSLPRTSDQRHHLEAEVPAIPPLHQQNPQSFHPSGPQVSFGPPPPTPWHSHPGRPPHPGKHIAPAIVYAPSHHSRSNYTPPAMFHHPPQMGPNGMIYSHSAPVHPTQYPPVGASPYPSGVPSSYHPSTHNSRRSGTTARGKTSRDRSQSISFGGATRGQPSSLSSDSSNDSGSTYYILPTAGQKVHIITPSPEQSIVTATSTTKSPTTPQSGSLKRPFFQRLFSFAKFSTAGSTKGSTTGGRKLQRRHSTGTSTRPTRIIELDQNE